MPKCLGKMQIFLMRHGQAGQSPPGGADRDRVLTSEGEWQVLAVGARIQAALKGAHIVASPYQRAQQTATLVNSVLRTSTPIETSGSLTPDSSVDEAWIEIRAHRQFERLLLVGHEPLFSSLAAFLIGFPQAALLFEPATVASVELVNLTAPQPRGVLNWMLAARLC